MSVGIVIQNLGSPDSPTAKDLRPYLKEFLMDPLVIDVPWLLRTLLVKAIIAPFRAKKSAEAYSQIWTKRGSPLVANTEDFCTSLAEKLKLPVLLTMRYGKLNPKYSLKKWVDENKITKIYFLSMYPQFALSSCQSSLDDFKRVSQSLVPNVTIYSTKDFFTQQGFVDCLSSSISKELQGFRADYVLFSYHGVPKRHLVKAVPQNKACTKVATCCDALTAENRYCYRAASFATTRSVIKEIGLKEGTFSTSFQSRLGSGWIEPFTDVVVQDLAKKGFKRLAVVTPSFTSDCLETLEEIGMRANEEFKTLGGEEFLLIPCLNNQNEWVETVSSWIPESATKTTTQNEPFQWSPIADL